MPRLPSLRGFGAAGLLSMALIAAAAGAVSEAGAAMVLLWAWLSGTPWSELGFSRAPSWPRRVVFAVIGGALFKFIMKAVVMPLFGAPPLNPAYQWLTGDAAALPGMFAAVIFGAGFSEELVFRGWMFERLRKLMGTSRPAVAGMILISSTLFALAHLQGQGLAGAEQAFILGVVFGALLARTGRIWPVMIAHASFDITAVLFIYFGIEDRVAHLIFR